MEFTIRLTAEELRVVAQLLPSPDTAAGILMTKDVPVYQRAARKILEVLDTARALAPRIRDITD